MRYATLLAATAVAALHNIGAVAVETVAQDYDRPEPQPSAARPPVEESLRVRMLRMERERKERRRADAAAKAEAGRDFVHRRNRDAT